MNSSLLVFTSNGLVQTDYEGEAHSYDGELFAGLSLC
jgi:hypothetical protein